LILFKALDANRQTIPSTGRHAEKSLKISNMIDQIGNRMAAHWKKSETEKN